MSPSVPTAPVGVLGGVHPSVDEITKAARQISLQVRVTSGCRNLDAQVYCCYSILEPAIAFLQGLEIGGFIWHCLYV
jgi:hypothetical protein